MKKQAEAVIAVALILLIGFNVGYFGPKLIPQGVQKMSIIPEAYALSTPASYLTFEGQLASSSGVPVTTAQTMNFSLWTISCTSSCGSTANGGTQNPSHSSEVYSEVQSSVTPDSRGIFYVQIGSGTCTSSSTGGFTCTSWPPSFSTAYYLAVCIGSSPCTMLSPWFALTAAPYLNGQVPWGNLITFPSACSAGSAVTGVTSTLQCSAFMTAISSTSCAAGSALYTASGTTVGCTALPIPISSTSCAAGAALTSVSSTAGACGTLSQYISTAATTSCASQSYVTSIGTAAAGCAQPIIEVTAAAQSMSTTTFASITGLSATIGVATYFIQAYIPYATAAATNGMFVGVACTSCTVTAVSLSVYEPLTATTFFDYVLTGTSSSSTTATGPGTTVEAMWVTGYITTSVGGTLQLLYGSSSTAAVTVQAGAWMKVGSTSA